MVFLLTLGCEMQQEPVYQPQFSSKAPTQTDIYLFGVHPLYNPKRLHEIFSPIMDYLSAHINNTEFRLEASRNYAVYNEKLLNGEFHFALPNPYQTVLALDEDYYVFGKMGDDENFRGIILVRKDSGINRVSELKGHAISYPAPTALAATMMPQYFLFENGLNVVKDTEIKYVGSQESSIMNVYLRNTIAGATWPPPWRAFAKERPDIAQQLEVKWTTAPLPNNSLIVRNDIPEELVKKVSALLFNLHTHSEGREWLERMELSRFVSADNSTYDPVRKFLAEFQDKVRPLNQ